MKKIAVFFCFVSAQVFAVDGVNSGTSLSSGPSSNHFSMSSSIQNPAMAPLMVPDGERWRINYLPSISSSTELGDVENFADDLDELVDLIDDPSTNTDSAEVTLDRFNDVLVRMGRNGYFKQSVNVSIPVTPAYYHSNSQKGTYFLDFNFGAQASLQVIDQVLRLDEQNQSFTTDTSIYVKSGIENKFSFGYGRQVFGSNKRLSKLGKFYAGVKLNLIQLELSKQITRLEDLDGEEVSDVIRDEYDENLKSNTGFGVDIGLVWDAEWYRAGFHIDNLIAPEFSYGKIGVNCESRTENTIERSSCELSQRLIADGRLKASEKHTKNTLLRVDGLLKITDRWFVSSALDLAEYDDIVGFENQWFNLAMSYESNDLWVPSARIGYQENLVGTGLSSYTFGFTFFKCVSLDFEWGTETITVDGDSAPRRFGFSIAFAESF